MAISTSPLRLRAETGAASGRRQARLFRRFASLGDRARDERNWFVAASYYEEVLRINTEHVGYWVQFGHALKESGQWIRAETAYRRALLLEPNNADTHLNLGHLLKLLDRPDEALKTYGTAHALAPDDKEIMTAFVALQKTL